MGTGGRDGGGGDDTVGITWRKVNISESQAVGCGCNMGVGQQRGKKWLVVLIHAAEGQE